MHMKNKFAAYMQTSRNLFIHRSNYFYLGDIMKVKLSSDEIEERKKQNILESAKMNSCISGIPLSDLFDSTFNRGNYSEKDCLIKQQFLKNLVEPVTSRELFETLKRQNYTGNYNTFRGLLFRYQKYGYVKKSNDRKPFVYQITDEGYQHVTNPYQSRVECIRQYNNFQNQKLANIINNDPVKFKEIYESIVSSIGGSVCSGVSVGSVGTQYSSNDYGSEEIKQDIESKINKDFFKDADPEKIEALTNILMDKSLTDDERKEYMIDALMEALNANKGSMILKQGEYQTTKSEGDRKYYQLIVNAMNHPVTRGLYEAIPFRFIDVGGDIRVKSRSESGTYRNNDDGIIMDFDYVNQKYFGNRMILTASKSNVKNEITFSYTKFTGKVIDKSYEITTMSQSDYDRAIKKCDTPNMAMNGQPIGGSPLSSKPVKKSLSQTISSGRLKINTKNDKP